MTTADYSIIDDLKANVDSVIETIHEGDPTDYMIEDALDYEFIIGSNGLYIGAEVTFCVGGPTVWADTRTARVYGAWGREEVSRSFDDRGALDDWLAEIYEISTRQWRH